MIFLQKKTKMFYCVNLHLFKSITYCVVTFSSSSPALMASSVGTPSSSSSAVPSMDLFTCFIKALKLEKETNVIIELEV